MPRIAHVISTPSGVGGAERILASLVHAAPNQGWDSFVVNPFAIDPHGAELSAICDPAPYLARHCRSWAEVPGTWRWLGTTLRRLRPQVVHSHLFHAEVAVASLPFESDFPTVLTHHHGDHFAYRRDRLRLALDRWAGRRHDRVVAISEYVRDFLINRYRYPPSRISLIRNGWEGTPQEPMRSRERPTVVCVANFRQQKGHTDLLAAFAIVRSRVQAAQLVLVGSGELESGLRRTVDQLGIGGSVSFRGSVDDVWAELAEADVFALASLYEPLGLAVMEAMAAGLPVVATSVGGVPELVKPNATGALVNPRDAEAMAHQIVRLLSDPPLAQRQGQVAQRYAGELRADKMADAYFDLYGELVDRPHSPAAS